MPLANENVDDVSLQVTYHNRSWKFGGLAWGYRDSTSATSDGDPTPKFERQLVNPTNGTPGVQGGHSGANENALISATR